MTAIQVRGLRKSYNGVAAVGGVDLDIRQGEVFALLGPNGAGKTTTVEILEGHRRRDDGDVSVLGEDPASASRAWRARIGIVLQTANDAAELTVRESVRHYAGYYPNPADPDVVIERVGLTAKAGARVKGLSGGQRRRLDVALGVIGQPELVFLDEPTTGFDPEARRQFWELIRNLAAGGTTILLTTHYLDEADVLCDRILVIDHGAIVAEGTPSELKAQVSGDRVEAGVPDQHVAATAEIAGKLPDAHEISTLEGTVRFRVPRGDTALPELLRALDAAGIPMNSVQVQRPTLDDVFLTLTGRSLRDAEAEPAPQAEAEKDKESTDVA